VGEKQRNKNSRKGKKYRQKIRARQKMQKNIYIRARAKNIFKHHVGTEKKIQTPHHFSNDRPLQYQLQYHRTRYSVSIPGSTGSRDSKVQTLKVPQSTPNNFSVDCTQGVSQQKKKT